MNSSSVRASRRAHIRRVDNLNAFRQVRSTYLHSLTIFLYTDRRLPARCAHRSPVGRDSRVVASTRVQNAHTHARTCCAAADRGAPAALLLPFLSLLQPKIHLPAPRPVASRSSPSGSVARSGSDIGRRPKSADSARTLHARGTAFELFREEVWRSGGPAAVTVVRHRRRPRLRVGGSILLDRVTGNIQLST